MNAHIFHGNGPAGLNIHYIGMVNIAAVNNDDLACADNFGLPVSFENNPGIFTDADPDAGRVCCDNLNQTSNAASCHKMGVKDDFFHKTEAGGGVDASFE